MDRILIREEKLWAHFDLSIPSPTYELWNDFYAYGKLHLFLNLSSFSSNASPSSTNLIIRLIWKFIIGVGNIEITFVQSFALLRWLRLISWKTFPSHRQYGGNYLGVGYKAFSMWSFKLWSFTLLGDFPILASQNKT